MRTQMLKVASLLLALAASSCTQSDARSADSPSDDVPRPTDNRPIVTVQSQSAGKPLDPRMFGTNVPAWVNPSQLADERVRALTRELGSTVLRLPGGSWSNAYNWLACENADSNGCYWTWASKPTDFLNFLRATGKQGMWTVSFNGTAKEAAALVAFFNGAVDDTTIIGVDARGRDWMRVQTWAQLRAAHGNVEPLPIRLWEVGNEVYGAKPATGGGKCIGWGWEDVWTCDPDEYLLGRGTGASHRDGYLDFRAAMRAVDPNIQVGAVGVPHPGDWWDWGTKVIDKGGANVDFYIIHTYGFDKQPANAAAILDRPQQLWKDILESTNAAFDKLGAKKRLPIAITEFNMAAFQDLDNGQLMTRAANALFIADMIGQMATHGATMANQWNLANGRAGNGTDYGLIDVASGRRAPQYYALKLWSAAGSTLLPVLSPISASTTLSVYASRSTDGAITLLAINKTGATVDVRLALAGTKAFRHITADVMTAENLDAVDVLFNNVADPAIDFANAPSRVLPEITAGYFDHSFPAYSITSLRLRP